MPAAKTPTLTKSITAIAPIAIYQPVSTAGAVPAAGESCLGFATQPAAVGDLVPIDVDGSTVGIAGAVIAFGNSLQIGTAGTLVPKTTGRIVGRALNSAAVGDQVEVLLDVELPESVSLGTNPLTGGATGLDVGGKQPFARSLQPNFVATRVLSGQANNFPTGGTNYTWSLQIAVPHDFVAVRLVLSSAVLADITGLTAAVSVGGTLSDRVNNGGTWTPALFNESATGTIPAATSGAEPNVVVTDWVPVESVPRVDGGVNRLVYLRLNTNTTNPNLTINGFGSGGSGGIALWNNKADGFTWCSRFQAGNFVASPSGMTAATEPQQTPIAGIQYMTRGPISNVLAFGDSITQCVQTTIPGDSWAYRALRDKGLPLGAFGWDGQSSAVYLARAKKVIPVLRPTHAFYPVFSPNDGILSAAVMTAQVNRALQFAELCKQNECTPIFWTGLPRTTNASNTASFFTIAQDAFRKRVNKAFTDSGYFVADIGGALSDTTDMATASKWASTAYLTLDGIHPNDTGHEAMAAVVSPVLAKLA